MGRPASSHGHKPSGAASPVLLATPSEPEAIATRKEHEVETVIGTDALVGDGAPMLVEHGDKRATFRALTASRTAVD
jgi:hypothetical protein